MLEWFDLIAGGTRSEGGKRTLESREGGKFSCTLFAFAFGLAAGGGITRE